MVAHFFPVFHPEDEFLELGKGCVFESRDGRIFGLQIYRTWSCSLYFGLVAGLVS